VNDTSNGLALVTGGSSGIGAAIAHRLAQRGQSLLLVARSSRALDEQARRLRSDFGVRVDVLAADLSSDEGVQAVIRHADALQIEVDTLINNAGFGDYGPFVDCSATVAADLIRVNALALTRLTHHFGRKMVARGRGRILNVASVAGFQPGPRFTVYSATKAYVVSFSEALHYELAGTGVTCTVLSPGVTETGFRARAGMQRARVFRSGVMNADDVARVGVDALLQGRLHAIPGLRNRVLGALSMMTPSRRLRLAISARILSPEPDSPGR